MAGRERFTLAGVRASVAIVSEEEKPRVTPAMRQAVRTMSAEARVVNAARKWRRMFAEPAGREKTSREQALLAAIDELDAALRGPELSGEPPDESA